MQQSVKKTLGETDIRVIDRRKVGVALDIEIEIILEAEDTFHFNLINFQTFSILIFVLCDKIVLFKLFGATET